MQRGVGGSQQQMELRGRWSLVCRWSLRRCKGHMVFCLTAILVFFQCACGVLDRERPAPGVTQEVSGPRVLVLPFGNSGHENEAYFAAGMTAEIAERLAAVPDIVVVSGTGIDSVGDTDDARRQAGEDLGAEYVLSGSFRRETEEGAEPKLVADLDLVRVSDRETLWTESYARPLSDVFAIQAEIAVTVVNRLGVEIQPEARRLLVGNTTSDLEAYEYYLRGLPHRWSFELRELGLAGDHFRRAVEIDPNFASAHVALSENHSLMFHFRYDRSPQRLANANAAAHRALELQPGLPEAHRALGYYYYWGQRNFEEALAKFSAAAAGRPNDPMIISSMGIVLRRQGRWEEAIEAFERVRQLDPLSEVNAVDLASTFGRMRRYSQGVAHCQRAIDLAPDDIFPYVFMARMLRTRDGSLEGARSILETMPDKDAGQQGYFLYEQALYERDFAAAVELLEPTEMLISDPINEEIFPRPLAECAGRVFGGSPATNVSACVEARTTLERARENSPVDPAVHAALGWTYALLGERDLAIAAGERAVELLPVSADALAGHSYLVRLAKIYARTDEPYSAVKTIEKALAMPGWLSLATLRLDPDWDPIRADPRFQELLRIHANTS